MPNKVKIGNIEINGHALLAPMAGVSDRAFRELCMNFGACLTFTEMVSSKGILYENKKTGDLTHVSENEHPCAVQIFGSEPKIMAESAKKALEGGADILDINMGCPVPKVVNNNSGSALLKNPKLCGEIVYAVKESINVPLTVKIRKGFDDTCINAVEIAQICEKNGADAITVHGRTREQYYKPFADIDIIKKVKESVNIPVIGNGDIFCAEDAQNMLEKTGCDLVMIGRGALGNPWIFSQINAWINDYRQISAPQIYEKMSVMLRHIELICKYKGEKTGMREARKHAVWYLKGFKCAAYLRNKAGSMTTLRDAEKLAYEAIKASAAED